MSRNAAETSPKQGAAAFLCDSPQSMIVSVQVFAGTAPVFAAALFRTAFDKATRLIEPNAV